MSSAGISSVRAIFQGVVGETNIRTAPAELSPYAVAGVSPSIVVLPENTAEAAQIVAAASDTGLALLACGSRSSLSVGAPPARYDVALDMTRVTGIDHYDPGDLTVSVKAGTLVCDLDRTLSANGQFLPLLVPFFSRATIAGAIATGLDSPLRHSYGTARDFLIGAEFIDGTGAHTKSGGRVVKNVTGYDFHKLLLGSLGTLAVITRLNFRTFPRPVSRRGLLASFADERAALQFQETVAASPLQPCVAEILSPEIARLFLEEKSPVASLRLDTGAWTACIGYEGSQEMCDRFARELSALALRAAARNAVVIHDAQFAALLEILREGPALLGGASANAFVFRFATLPAHLLQLLAAVRSFAASSWSESAAIVRSGSIIYLALLPQDRADTEAVTRQLAYFWKSVSSLRAQMELNASILFGPPDLQASLNPWLYAPADLELHRKVKQAFDPKNIFAPGRFVGGI
jgi:glycolate oxidase FAD binding subunit